MSEYEAIKPFILRYRGLIADHINIYDKYKQGRREYHAYKNKDLNISRRMNDQFLDACDKLGISAEIIRAGRIPTPDIAVSHHLAMLARIDELKKKNVQA